MSRPDRTRVATFPDGSQILITEWEGHAEAARRGHSGETWGPPVPLGASDAETGFPEPDLEDEGGPGELLLHALRASLIRYLAAEFSALDDFMTGRDEGSISASVDLMYGATKDVYDAAKAILDEWPR